MKLLTEKINRKIKDVQTSLPTLSLCDRSESPRGDL